MTWILLNFQSSVCAELVVLHKTKTLYINQNNTEFVIQTLQTDKKECKRINTHISQRVYIVKHQLCIKITDILFPSKFPCI